MHFYECNNILEKRRTPVHMPLSKKQQKNPLKYKDTHRNIAALASYATEQLS